MQNRYSAVGQVSGEGMAAVGQQEHHALRGDDEEEEDEEEEDEGEERECDECGDWYPRGELDEDGFCFACAEREETMGQVRRVQSLLPGNMAVREVAGNHRKPCSRCGKDSWYPGEWYVYDAAQPWGSDKFCLDCAEMEFDGASSDEEFEGEGESEEESEEEGEESDADKQAEVAENHDAEERPAQRQRVA